MFGRLLTGVRAVDLSVLIGAVAGADSTPSNPLDWDCLLALLYGVDCSTSIDPTSGYEPG